mmetsp:Transcript_10872/g.13606  ORF Transcript_10872/g.13606 Transcript_10872/m.13606 type:complete len:167 (-) Transcript_10872:1882-2382(-)
MAAPNQRVMQRNAFVFRSEEDPYACQRVEAASNSRVKVFTDGRSSLTFGVEVFVRLCVIVIVCTIGWKVRLTEIGLAVACLSLGFGHIVQTLYFCFPLNIKVVKIGQLCRTLGTPWMLVALESTSLQCGILSEKTGGFFDSNYVGFYWYIYAAGTFWSLFFCKIKS